MRRHLFSLHALGVALVAAAVPTLAIDPIDCSAGCGISADLVCGDNGLTFMGACLALCSGFQVVHDGPCASPVLGPVTSAQSPQDLSKHPYAKMLDVESSGVSQGPVTFTSLSAGRQVSIEDLSRYASMGLQLVGVAKPAGEPGPDIDVVEDDESSSSNTEDALELRDVVIDLATNLVYMSSDNVLDRPPSDLSFLAPTSEKSSYTDTPLKGKKRRSVKRFVKRRKPHVSVIVKRRRRKKGGNEMSRGLRSSKTRLWKRMTMEVLYPSSFPPWEHKGGMSIGPSPGAFLTDRSDR